MIAEAATQRLDDAATQRRREELRRARLKRGRPYGEFVREWSQQRPPAAILRYYGTYPDPAQGMQPALPMASGL